MQCSIPGTLSQGESFLLFCKQLMLYWWEVLVQERRKNNNNNKKEKNYCCNKTVSVQSGGESLNSELKKFRFETSPFYFRACSHPRGFTDSSAGNESACNAGDSGSIPGSRRSPGEGIGYPLHYSWASLVAQLVKNPPAKRETWVRSLRWEDPLEKGKATCSSILAWRIPWTL